MITADQIVVHLVGDYIFQSDWMANEKTKKFLAAFMHALLYSLCFLVMSPSFEAWLVIFTTHFIIDRYRLARYICWLKNFMSPVEHWSEKIDLTGQINTYSRWNHPWSECSATGYHKDRPPWLAVWLLIIADNTMHVIINGLALHYL